VYGVVDPCQLANADAVTPAGSAIPSSRVPGSPSPHPSRVRGETPRIYLGSSAASVASLQGVDLACGALEG
jgi:hypothetical protein